MGARFAKWRAVIRIADGMPSAACVSTNAHALARYAAICQEQGLVPIIEPEVLMDGTHDAQRCYDVTAEVLDATFDACAEQGIHCLLYTSPSPRDQRGSRMPSSA